MRQNTQKWHVRTQKRTKIAAAGLWENKRCSTVTYIGASIYCNIGASNALSKEGDFRDSRRDLGQLIVIWVIVIWVIPNVFFAGAKR